MVVELLKGLTVAFVLLWSLCGLFASVVMFDAPIVSEANLKQKIFLVVALGPLVWIGGIIAIVGFGFMSGTTYIYDWLGDD